MGCLSNFFGVSQPKEISTLQPLICIFLTLASRDIRENNFQFKSENDEVYFGALSTKSDKIFELNDQKAHILTFWFSTSNHVCRLSEMKFQFCGLKSGSHQQQFVAVFEINGIKIFISQFCSIFRGKPIWVNLEDGIFIVKPTLAMDQISPSARIFGFSERQKQTIVIAHSIPFLQKDDVPPAHRTDFVVFQ